MTHAKIGLALGSGAARGLAHIGVLKVLERNNIPIDYISGASIGAVVGALYAATRNVAEMEKVVTEADWKLFLSLIDPTVVNGMIKGEKIKKFLRRFVGDMTFADLKIPLAVVATDLQTGEPVILDKGDVVDAIMASSTVPLVFQPVKMNDHILVDGGLSHPVPTQILRERGMKKVIAVNLDADFFTKKKVDLSPGAMAMQMITLMRYHLAEYDAALADVVIAPEVGGIFGTRFNAGPPVIDMGEKAAQKVLPQIKKLAARN
ncbi:MAG: patatin-like phospholipase family protein [Patescibacteria group bacterium]